MERYFYDVEPYFHFYNFLLQSMNDKEDKPVRAGIDFWRQNLTSEVDLRTERIKHV